MIYHSVTTCGLLRWNWWAVAQGPVQSQLVSSSILFDPFALQRFFMSQESIRQRNAWELWGHHHSAHRLVDKPPYQSSAPPLRRLLREGFLRSIQLCLQLRPHGLCTAGPPCGSFVFLNMGTSLRSKNRPLGGPRPYVRLANLTLGFDGKLNPQQFSIPTEYISQRDLKWRCWSSCDF